MFKGSVILLVGTECKDPSAEAEFNRWYSETHMPEVLQQAGILSGTRFDILRPLEGWTKYLAVYDCEDESAVENLRRQVEKDMKGEARIFTPGPAPYEVVYAVEYRRIHP